MTEAAWSPADGAGCVISVRPDADGSVLHLRVRDRRAGGRTLTLSLGVGDDAALDFRPIEGMTLTSEQLEALETAAQRSEAYRRGVALLGYGANSASALRRKLTQRGFDATAAEQAVETLQERGYLQESRDACRIARQLFARGRGLRRILQELRAKGYGEQALVAAREVLLAEDFVESCVGVARKKCPLPPQETREWERLTAYLLRCGFGASEVRAALRLAYGERA